MRNFSLIKMKVSVSRIFPLKTDNLKIAVFRQFLAGFGMYPNLPQADFYIYCSACDSLLAVKISGRVASLMAFPLPDFSSVGTVTFLSREHF